MAGSNEKKRLIEIGWKVKSETQSREKIELIKKMINKYQYLTKIKIVGWNISRFHNQELVLGALEQALAKHQPLEYFHSQTTTVNMTHKPILT